MPVSGRPPSDLRVLMVDDDAAIRNVVSLALGDEGFNVICAADGQEALEAIRRSQPDLILLDMRMPVMDGWAFASAYRQEPPPHAPIVVLTAARDAAAVATEIGARECLAKPFDLDDLIACVRRLTKS